MSAGITILRREGGIGSHAWRQYLVVTDGRVAIVEMIPVAFLPGWNFHRVTIQDGDAWDNWSRESILAWKLKNDTDGLTHEVSFTDNTGFRSRLLERAGVMEGK